MKKSFAFVALLLCVAACGRNGENALSQSEAQGNPGYYRVYPNQPRQPQKNYVQYYDEKSGKYYWAEDTRYNHNGGYYYAPSNAWGWQGQNAGRNAGRNAGKHYYKNDEGYGYVPNPGRYYVEKYAPHAADNVPKFIPAPKHKSHDDSDVEGYKLVDPSQYGNDYDSDDSKDSWRDWGRSIGRYYRNRYGN